MEGKTHRVGGMIAVLGGYLLLDSKGLLLKDANAGIQLASMYPFAIYGSIMSDLDHHWKSCPSKDLVSYGLNRCLHIVPGACKKARDLGASKGTIFKASIVDAQHRSWQTHSDVALGLILFSLYWILGSDLSYADKVLLLPMVTGLSLGLVSHLVLDLLTPEGIWSLLYFLIRLLFGKKEPKKFSIFPNTEFFSTGGPWEKLIRKLLWVASFGLMIYVIYTLIPYEIKFN